MSESTNKARRIDAMQRAETLLAAVVAFIEGNPVAGYEVYYDEAICDGYCLQADCEVALEELRNVLREGM